MQPGTQCCEANRATRVNWQALCAGTAECNRDHYNGAIYSALVQITGHHRIQRNRLHTVTECDTSQSYQQVY